MSECYLIRNTEKNIDGIDLKECHLVRAAVYATGADNLSVVTPTRYNFKGIVCDLIEPGFLLEVDPNEYRTKKNRSGRPSGKGRGVSSRHAGRGTAPGRGNRRRR